MSSIQSTQFRVADSQPLVSGIHHHSATLPVSDPLPLSALLLSAAVSLGRRRGTITEY